MKRDGDATPKTLSIIHKRSLTRSDSCDSEILVITNRMGLAQRDDRLQVVPLMAGCLGINSVHHLA